MPAVAGVTAVAVTFATGLGWGWLDTLDAGRARLSLLSPLTGLGTAVGALDAVLLAGLLAGGGRVRRRCSGWRGRPARRADGAGRRAAGGRACCCRSCSRGTCCGASACSPPAGPRAAAALGAACLVLCLAIAPSGRHVVRPPLYGLPTVLAAAVALVVARTGAHTTGLTRAKADDG